MSADDFLMLRQGTWARHVVPTFAWNHDHFCEWMKAMLHILLVTPRLQGLTAFSQTLASDPEVRLESVGSGAEALNVIRATPPHLAVVDVDLPDALPMELVQRMLMVNAMVNSSVVSPLSEEEFHEASEGLGVLSNLPLDPGRDDAKVLLVKLRKVMGLVA